MDHARDYHFVKQMPRRTVAEVDTQDATMDRQVLLNETWDSYVTRLGRPAEVGEEHTKWITESWAEYEARAIERAKYMAAYDAQQDALQQANRVRDQEKKAAQDRNVAALMRADDQRIAADRTSVKHSLLLDFDDLRAERERVERADLESLEQKHRLADVEDPERQARNELRATFSRELTAIIDELERRRLAAEAEAERQRQERLRREQAAREAEERRRKEAEDAERRRREAEEEAKRAERRRKDEERRARAKAEREAARGGKPAAPGSAALNQSKQLDTSGQDKTAKFSDAAAARTARASRSHTALDAYAQAVEADAAKAGSLGEAHALCRRVANEMGGSGGLLFHTSVYVGLVPSAVDPAANTRASDPLDSFAVAFASSNSSAHMRSGSATFTGAEGACVSNCIRQASTTGVIGFNHGALTPAQPALACIEGGRDVNALGCGEFFAAPIVAPDGQTSFGHVALDTSSDAPCDPENTLQAATEAAVYTDGKVSCCSVDEEAATKGNGMVPISAEVQAAVVRIGKALGAALHQVTAAPAEDGKTGVPSFDASAAANANDLLGLYAALCAELTRKLPFTNGDVYVSSLNRADGDAATVVCHRGVTVADPAATRSASDCIGRTLALSSSDDGAAQAPDAPTFGLVKAAASGTRSAHIANVADATSKAVAYASGKTLQLPSDAGAQELLMLPLRTSGGQTLAIVGIAANRANAGDECQLSGDVRAAIEAFIFGDQLQGAVARLQRKAMTAAVATQALDWLTITTGKDNAYIALQPENAGADQLEIVAASESQAWLLHRRLAASDAGIVHPFVKAAGSAASGSPDLVAHVPDVTADTPLGRVRMLNDAVTNASEVKGQMVAAAITLRHSGEDSDANAPVFGVLCVDTVNSNPDTAAKSKKKGGDAASFNDSDKELCKTTAYLLAEALSDVASGKASSSNEGRKMAVESVVDRSHLLFLSKVWSKVTHDIEQIKKSQLDEVKSYNNPPAVIHNVCAATFIVMGSKPANVSSWDNTRKKVSHETVKKMVAFDPTSKKVKKAFSMRAKKMTAGLTAHDVFTKGSYPASCFFSWTFVVILLRKAADRLRKRAAAGTLGLGAVASDDMASTATGGTADFGSDNEAEAGDDLEAADDDAPADDAAAE